MLNKVTLITGAGSGIGRATALLLAKEGHKIGLLDLNHPSKVLKEIQNSNGEAMALQCDVTDRAAVDKSVEEFVKKYGKLTGAVNSAGLGDTANMGTPLGSLSNMSDDTWHKLININLNGLMYSLRAEVRNASETGCSIVNISSKAGRGPTPFNSAYGAAKTGVISLSGSVALEVAREGIRVNTIAPGVIDTPLLHKFNEDVKKRFTPESQPIGRIGTPEDVASAVAFLIGEESGFITGAVLDVGGGLQ